MEAVKSNFLKKSEYESLKEGWKPKKLEIHYDVPPIMSAKESICVIDAGFRDKSEFALHLR